MSLLNASIVTLSVIPECLYHPSFVTPAIFKPGSTVFKNKEKIKAWMPDKGFQA